MIGASRKDWTYQGRQSYVPASIDLSFVAHVTSLLVPAEFHRRYRMWLASPTSKDTIITWTSSQAFPARNSILPHFLQNISDSCTMHAGHHHRHHGDKPTFCCQLQQSRGSLGSQLQLDPEKYFLIWPHPCLPPNSSAPFSACSLVDSDEGDNADEVDRIKRKLRAHGSRKDSFTPESGWSLSIAESYELQYNQQNLLWGCLHRETAQVRVMN